jgi:succinate--hydroxymethylglutarate CoA-transferase
MMLGDLGAGVTKVEHVLGDDTRTWGPPFAKKDHKFESAYFLCVNRNKRSITVNFKDPQGLEIVRKLATRSDVLVENYLPGKLESLGLGYEDLKSENPGLIYASITGYGQTGPYSSRPGYDVIIEAEAGLMHITGESDGAPVKVGVAITDLTTGLYTKGAILAALYHREKTGLGQRIDASLLECQIASLANIASNFLVGGQEAKRWGTRHGSIVPYQSFETKDGHIVVGAGNDRQYEKFCVALKRQDLLDERFATNELRVHRREELVLRFNPGPRDYQHNEEENYCRMACNPRNSWDSFRPRE